MDPDKALARLVALSEGIVQDEALAYQALLARAEELAETFLGLDEWLRKGGFAPQPWRKQPSVGTDGGAA